MSNEVEEAKMPLLDHLIELRRRLVYSVISFLICFLICFYFADPIFNFLVEPLANLWKGQEQRRLIYTALHEKFFTDIKVAFFGLSCRSSSRRRSCFWPALPSSTTSSCRSPGNSSPASSKPRARAS
jgi:hypothetical protein